MARKGGTAAAAGGGSVAPSVSMGGSTMPITVVPPPTVRAIANFTLEHATMLAGAPRKRWSEHTEAALAGLLAALPSAADAIRDAIDRKPISFEPFELVQILIFFGFIVWFITCIVGNRDVKTADDYLREFYQLPSPQKPPQKWFWPW